MTNNFNVAIRRFNKEDRIAVRKICTDTAFMGRPASVFFLGDEFLADVLTQYFTDYEPESCFVAVFDNRVVGYIIGSRNVSRMKNIFLFKIFPRLLVSFFGKGIFFNKKNIDFFCYCIKSFFRGEFFVPCFSKEYPAALHINIDNNCRGLNLGKKLMEQYLFYLRENSIAGVQCSTVSEGARGFFVKQGFSVLFKKKRTYWKKYLGEDLFLYILGKKLI